MTDMDQRTIEERLRTFLHRSVSLPLPPTLAERLLRLASPLPSLPVRSWRPPAVGAAAAGLANRRERGGSAAASATSTGARRRLGTDDPRVQRVLSLNDRPWNQTRTLAQRMTGGEELKEDL